MMKKSDDSSKIGRVQLAKIAGSALNVHIPVIFGPGYDKIKPISLEIKKEELLEELDKHDVDIAESVKKLIE